MKGSKINAMDRLRMFPLLIATGTILCASALIGQEVAPAARIVDRIDENQLVTLKGNTHPMARARNDRGRVSPDLPMTDLILVLSRSPEQQEAFDQFVASQYDHSSPNFHQWLEPEDVGERFGPAQGDIDAVTGWLNGHGFSVDEVANNRMTVRFSGTAAEVESAFHTEIHNLEVKGVAHIGNMTDPQIPAALAPAVVGVKALHNFFPRPLHRLGSQVTRDKATGKWKRIVPVPEAASQRGKPGVQRVRVGPQYNVNDSNNGYLIEDVVPYDFATIYNVLPLWNAGIDGTGQVIAIAGTSDIDVGQSGETGADGANDIKTFRQAFGLPTSNAANTPKRVSGNSQPLTVCTSTASGAACGMGDLEENTLDVEWSGSVAKNAQIVLVASYPASTSDDNLWDSESYIVDNVGKAASPVYGAHQMNVSYGECELGNGTTANVSYYNLWQTAAAEGISVFVATGDSGSPTCDDGGDASGTPYEAQYGLSVSGLASSPWDTAVGGTDFNWCAANATTSCTASPYWSSTNASTGASAAGYVPEMPWNDTCASPDGIYEAEYFASELDQTWVKDAETACNFAADSNYEEELYIYAGEDMSGLVDVVGGSGGASGCVVNTTSSAYSNTSLGTCTTGASSTGTVTGISGNSIASIPLTNNGWKKPSWQTNAKIPGLPKDGVRDIPDVSFFAADGFNGSAYLICVSQGGSCTYSDTTENTAQEVGGTSVASPAMAGVMALINQKAGEAQGSPNAELYALAAKQSWGSCSADVTGSSSCYFHDIDAGPYSGMPYTNAMPCEAGSPNCNVIYSGDPVGILSGYNAVTGYDEATGLGSLNVANVVNANVWSVPVPVVSLSSTKLTFSSTLVGAKATAQTVSLKNTGNAKLTLNTAAFEISGTDPSSFLKTSTTCGASLAAGSSCTITIAFTPKEPGALTAVLELTDNASGSPQKVSLNGTGVGPAVSLSHTALTFPSTAVGYPAAVQSVTLKNTGNAALTMANPAFTITGTNASSFSKTTTCGASVAVGASCSVTLTFTPKALGSLSAVLKVADNAAGSPQIVDLSGTGKAPAPAVTLSVPSLVFSVTQVGTSAATKQLTVTNTGTAALTWSNPAVSISGAGAGSYSQTNTCTKALAVNADCVIIVTFKPKAAGALSATVKIADNVSGSPQTVPLSGTGTLAAVSLTPASLTFASTKVGTTLSATQAITLKNTGTGLLSLTGSGISIAGTNATSFLQKNTCGVSVAAGASCKITVSFKPAVTGSLSATVSVADNAAGSPQTVKLSGIGH
jgi:subtilase family serine protease